MIFMAARDRIHEGDEIAREGPADDEPGEQTLDVMYLSEIAENLSGQLVEFVEILDGVKALFDGAGVVRSGWSMLRSSARLPMAVRV